MRALEMRARHDHIGSGHPAAVGKPPCVGVKHGGQHQDRIAFLHRKTVYRARSQCMQVGRALTVCHTLGIPGGTTGITDARRRVFLCLWPGIFGRSLSHQRVIGNHALIIEHSGITRHQQKLNSGQQWEHRVKQFGETAIHHQKTILRMIDDVSNMLGRQAAVNGVEHAAH